MRRSPIKGVRKGSIIASLACCRGSVPARGDIYVRASPLQRTRATAQALVDGAFPGCGVAIHYVSGDADPLFRPTSLARRKPTPSASWRQ